MREHRSEPGKGHSLTGSGHHDAHDPHDASTVGKSTLTGNLSASSAAISPAAASASTSEPTARASNAEDEVDLYFDLSKNAWEEITDNRKESLAELDQRLAAHREKVPGSVLAELGKIALDTATAHIGSLVLAKVADAVKKDLEKHLFDGAKHSTHVLVEQTNDRAHDFVLAQRLALDHVKRTTADRFSFMRHDKKIFVRHHPDKAKETIEEIKSIRNALNHHAAEATQLQYNITLAKWFSALAQSSFGKNPNRKNATDLGKGKLSTAPLNGIQSDFGDTNTYGGMQGYLHLGLLVGPKGGHVSVTRFHTPGIDKHAWDYQFHPEGLGGDHDPDISKSLGQLALNNLPKHVRIPVIADVSFHLDTTDKEVKKHFPGGESGRTFQPIAVSWNEKNIVTIELPTKGPSDYPINTGDQKFLAAKFVEATGQGEGAGDINAAARWLMHTKIGAHSLVYLQGLAPDKDGGKENGAEGGEIA
ncbi:MAG TPA: hypothetical protein VLM79_39295 [Kofleriaceae bacterium]|nr:hypothetical protein [Kofleriaceae bacterium]